MKVKKSVLLWLFILVPFFYPSGIAGTAISALWYRWKICATFVGVLYIFTHIKRVKKIEHTVWMIIVFYIMQLVATGINGLDLSYDTKTLVMMTIFLLVSAIVIQEGGNRGILLFYRIMNIIIWLNFLSVIFLYGKGLVLDSYDTPIYFWSTKNHIISLVIAYLTIAKYLYSEHYIRKIDYLAGIGAAIISTLLMGSSTAIIALMIYGIFILYCYVSHKRDKPVNIKYAVIWGTILEILVVVFRIQEHFASAISLLFGKDVTLTGRTDLWDQAIQFIGINPWFGKGNSYAIAQYGWLTKQYWDPILQNLDDVYFVAHNQILEIMLNGGIVCLLFFLLAFFVMIGSARKISNNLYKNYIGAAVLAYFIAMITDLVSPYEPMYLFLIVCSYMYRCKEK